MRHTLSSLIYVYLSLSYLNRIPGPIVNRQMDGKTVTQALTEYENAHAFLRRYTFPEEDRGKYTSAKWAGEYRWFRSPNAVCLEKVRLLKAQSASPRTRRAEP